MPKRNGCQIVCCKECGRDTRNLRGVCSRCLGGTSLHDLTPEEWAERNAVDEDSRDFEIQQEVIESLGID